GGAAQGHLFLHPRPSWRWDPSGQRLDTNRKEQLKMQDTIGLTTYRILILSLIMGSGPLHAQKEPQYTQYMYNIGSFNPAYVGTVESLEIMGLYRAQWVDIPGAPTTIRGGANIPFKNGKMGMGVNVVNDELGPSNQTFIDLAYSYQVQLSGDTKLSFGLNAGGAQLDIDYSKGSFVNPSDPS